jgi:cytochrome P450 PksS
MEFRKMMMPITETLANGAIGFLLYAPTAFRLERFLRRLVTLRREEPGDDMVTALVRAEEAGDRLNEEELVAMVFLLLLAGHETTVNLIGNGTLALMEHPDQLQKIVDHPELIDSAIEELLRFSSPVTQLARFTREDVEIKGHRIPRGSTVILLMASANRDEAAFANADQLDVARTPNRHVSFGYGVHYCLGAPLARLEGRIAMLDLLRRFPQMRLAVPREKVRWRKSFGLRGMRTLPLHLGPAASKATARSSAQAAVHAVAGAP